MSRDGGLPPGVTDADIDRAAPGYFDPPYHCDAFDDWGIHCSEHDHYRQCARCRNTQYRLEVAARREAQRGRR